MKNWKKIVACTVMGVAAACLSIFGITIMPTQVDAASVRYSGDITKWQTSNNGVIAGFLFNNTDGKLYLHEPTAWSHGGYKTSATSKTIDGNATINMTMTGDITESGYWGYNWIIFQDTSEKYTNTISTETTVCESTEWTPRKVRDVNGVTYPANSSGNWMALVYGVSEDGVNLYECNSGVVTKVKTIATDVSARRVHNATTNISITMTDTDSGVDMSIGYEINGKQYSSTYTSGNNGLWGETTFTVGYWGSVRPTPPDTGIGYKSGTIAYDISVSETQATHAYESYNTGVSDKSKWVDTQNITEGNGEYLTVSETAAGSATRPSTDGFVSRAETKQVGGDSTLDLTMTANIKRGAAWSSSQPLWGYDYVLFKNTNNNSGKDWTPNSNDDYTNYAGGADEHWMAVGFGASIGAKIYECKGGKVTSQDIQNDLWKQDGVSSVAKMSGYDVWYTYAQTTHVRIVTKDTDTGVEVKFTFYAQDCTNIVYEWNEDGTVKSSTPVYNTGYVYEYTYFSENTNLWGQQSYVIGHYGNGAFDSTENYHYDVRIMDVDSPYYKNVAGTPLYWDLENSVNGPTNVTTLGDEGMRFNFGVDKADSAAMLLKRNIKADSTINLTVKGKATTSTSVWANMAIQFKDTSPTRDADALLNYIIATGGKKNGTIADTTANWIGVYFGSTSNNFDLYECVNGVVTYINTYRWGTNYWYLGYGQTTKLTITTTDVPKGDASETDKVLINFTITSSGSTHSAVASDAKYGITETYTYEASGTHFGDYGFSVGVYSNDKTANEYIDLSDMEVYEKGIDHTLGNASSSGLYMQDARGASLSMEGDVAVNFYVALAPSILADTTAQVDFYMDGMLYKSDFLSALNPQVIDGTKCYKISCGIAPKDYQKTVRIIMTADGTRYEMYNGTVITDYIATAKESENTYVKDAVEALENYCEGARNYFAEETVAESSVKTDDVKADANKMTYEIWNTGNTKLTIQDFGYSSVSLVLEEEITFRLGIRADDISKYNVSVDMNLSDEDKLGVAQSWVQRDTGNGEWYYVDVTGIKISDLDKKFTITIELPDFSRCTFTCSAFSYMRAVFKTEEKEGADTNLINLLKQMYLYYQKANAYNTSIKA